MTENRTATEALMTAFERLAQTAGGKGWPLELVADASLRAGMMLAIAHHGVPRTAAQCRNLADDLDRLADLLAAQERTAA